MTAMAGRGGGRLLLVGWDSADWRVLNPLLEAGVLPHTAALIGRGTMGTLASLAPQQAAPVWTSMATGMHADRHGILDDVGEDPLTGERCAITSTSRRGKAIWNILAQSGLRTNLINWPASHPAEPVPGKVFSDRFVDASGSLAASWPLAAGCVSPEIPADEVAALRVHPEEISPEDLLPFIPGIGRLDLRQDRRPALVARALAETMSVHAAATWSMAHGPWDATLVRYHGLRLLGPHLLALRAPRLAEVSEEDFLAYRGVIDGFCRLQDMMLGRLLELAGPNATVVLVSEHGVCSDASRTRLAHAAGPRPSGSAHWGAWSGPTGIVCMAGPVLRADALVHGAGVLDVVPTLLAGLGLPVGEDMPGRALLEAFSHPPVMNTIASWEKHAGAAGLHPPVDAIAIARARISIDQLAALGYAEFDAHEQRQRDADHFRQSLNRAFSQASAGRLREAIDSLRALWHRHPGDGELMLKLAACHLAVGDREACAALLGSLPDGATDRPEAALLLGIIAADEGRHEAALGHLMPLCAASERDDRHDALVNLHLGLTLERLGRLEDAEQALRRACQHDRTSGQPQLALASLLLAGNRPQQAAQAALQAIGVNWRCPQAHALLGVALAATGRIDRAVLALRTSIAQAPSTLAHECMARIAELALRDPMRAADHRRSAKALESAQRRQAPAALAETDCAQPT